MAAYDGSNNFVASGFTDSAGRYAVSGLAAGSYKVGFQSCGGGNYLSQFYDGKSSLATADAVSVSAGSTTSGIDAALQQGGQITGTVTDALTHAGIANIQVSASDSSGNNPGGFTTTDSSGHYTLSGLGSGSYRVQFSSGFGGNYITQYYDNKPSLATADAVSVTVGESTSGIDAGSAAGRADHRHRHGRCHPRRGRERMRGSVRREQQFRRLRVH